jgi:hypothetical protein
MSHGSNTGQKGIPAHISIIEQRLPMQHSTRVLGLILCLGFAAGTWAQEKKIATKDLPAPVLASFQKTYPNAAIKGVSTETEKGKTYFEIESIDGKVKRDLLYLADGTVTEVEESVSRADLPAPVNAAVTATHPKARIVKAEKITRTDVVSYDVLIRSGRQRFEMSIDPTGKVMKDSKMSVKTEGKKEAD